MAGRGRGLTLPAWMTEGGLKPVDISVVEPAVPATVPDVARQIPVQVPARAAPTARFVPPTVPMGGPRPPSHNPPYGQNAQAMNHNVPFHAFPPVNGFPAPSQTPVGMMNQFMPPMQPNNFMGMGGQPFSNQNMIPNFVPPTPMPMNMAMQLARPPLHGMASAPVQPKAPPPPTVIGDPNNDVSCWAEHESEAGKKYWYNRVSLVSTYDKPFCLKTPEERSIPACEWKEYAAADGKKYYSNGKESLWTMPEEFRIWKELVDAAEQKKLQQAVARAAEAVDASIAASAAAAEAKSREAAAARSVPVVVYATAADAAEAFKDMLSDMKVTTIAKMKEVQDLCQHDVRWEALKSQGEKKQALAEYQTKRLKIEKETQKMKARKQRDAFLLMLAENTDIDARTRWRDATTILQDDARYKNVEDARDREDLFLEFIVELEKKEKEDKRRQREAAIAHFNKVLADFAEDSRIDHRSVWADSKKIFLDLIVRAEFRAMDDSDFRRCFQAFTTELLEAHKVAERRKKEEFERALAAAKIGLREVLEGAASGGLVTSETRWKEVLALEEVVKAPAFVEMQALFPADSDSDSSRFTTACKDVFASVQDKLYEQYRIDRRLVKDILHSHNYKVKHDTAYAAFRTFALKVARMQECAPAVEGGDDNGAASQAVPAPGSVPVLEPAVVLQEEGEEHDDLPGENLKALMVDRPSALATIFAELHKKAVADHEEELQYARKVEKKFVALLAENFYRAEHADIPWDDAKRTLQRRSVYDELSKSDRKRLFAEHMDSLRAPKSRSGSFSVSVPGTVEGPAPAPRRRSESKDRRRQRSRSHSHSNRGRDSARGERDRGGERERSHGRRVVVEVDRELKRSVERDGDDSRGKRARR